MKKLAAILVLCLMFALPALADVDLSGMTYDELLQLRADVDAAIWNSDGWQEVTVPAGVYKMARTYPPGVGQFALLMDKQQKYTMASV